LNLQTRVLLFLLEMLDFHAGALPRPQKSATPPKVQCHRCSERKTGCEGPEHQQPAPRV